jgi:hypothetical protein
MHKVNEKGILVNDKGKKLRRGYFNYQKVGVSDSGFKSYQFDGKTKQEVEKLRHAFSNGHTHVMLGEKVIFDRHKSAK